MAAAVERVIEGEVGKVVSTECGILYRTLKKYVGARKNGEPIVKSRRGPAPWLTAAAKRNLYDWIVAMRRDGSPVDRRGILLKERQPSLATRQAQMAAHVQNEVDFTGVDILFATMSKLVIENKLSSCQLYNMNETAFQTRKKSKRVVAVKGSKCVWSKSVTTSFHLTIAACANASGHAIPFIFILPGGRVDKRLLNEFSVPDGRVACTPSEYMNRKLFVKWIQFFSETVSEGVSRPVMLMFDGYRSHYSPGLMEMSMRLQVLLVCLLPNATHIFQPQDISVFAPLKKLIRNLVDDTALRTGFAAAGIFPTSKVQMKKRVLLVLEGGGLPQKNEAEWLIHLQVIRTDTLLLTARHSAPKRSRKTVDVDGRLVTAEMLQQTV